MDFSDEQFLNAPPLILVTPSGIVILSNDSQFMKQLRLIFSKPEGSETEVSFEHSENAQLSIIVTLFGITILRSDLHDENA